MLLLNQFWAKVDWFGEKFKENEENPGGKNEERNLSERMPEKKEVRKTKPIARDPTIAEEKERKKPDRKEGEN